MGKIKFGKISTLRKEKFNPVSENESRRCIELEHINQNDGTINGWVDSSNQLSIKNIFYKGDVLFSKLRPYLRKYWLAEFDGVCSSEIWVLKANNEIIESEYLFNLVQTNFFIQQANVSSGTKMPRADWNHIVNCSFFIINSLPEQKVIAEVLSTWDKAIEQYETLLQQYELRKKWLMQNLLTGKKRLEGFEGEWKEVKLKDIGKTFSGGTPLRNKKEYYNGKIPWIKSGELNSIIVTDVEEYITEEGLKNSSAKLIEPGTILIAMYGATAGVTAISEIKGAINQAILAFETDPVNNNYFLFYLIQYLMPKTVFSMVQGGQPNLSAGIINDVKLKLPTNKEQKAIANLLQTADKEIELTKERIERLREQKKGLMQQLLTGRKRMMID